MTSVLRKVSIVLSLAVMVCSCVSQKQYTDLAKDKDRLDVNVERAHKEIRELKDVKLTLEDQIKAKNVEITKLEQQVNNFKRQNEEMGTKFSGLDDQMKKMMADLEAKKSESASLIASYEQKITELQIANAYVINHSGSRNNNRSGSSAAPYSGSGTAPYSATGRSKSSRRNSRAKKSKVALPAALKI